jgi:hypothetical protein
MHTHTEKQMKRLAFGNDCGVGLHHPLAYAGQLWHRVLINQETVLRVARDLGFEANVCRGVLRLLKKAGRVPSKERLAVICQLDPGYDDADVGEVFGETAEWSASVRRHAAMIREAEPIPEKFEWFDDGLRPSDPTPEEIYARAKEVRVITGMGRSDTGPGIRAFTWRGRSASFLQVSPD